MSELIVAAVSLKGLFILTLAMGLILILLIFVFVATILDRLDDIEREIKEQR